MAFLFSLSYKCTLRPSWRNLCSECPLSFLFILHVTLSSACTLFVSSLFSETILLLFFFLPSLDVSLTDVHTTYIPAHMSTTRPTAVGSLLPHSFFFFKVFVFTVNRLEARCQSCGVALPPFPPLSYSPSPFLTPFSSAETHGTHTEKGRRRRSPRKQQQQPTTAYNNYASSICWCS